MFWRIKAPCTECGGDVVVYPASIHMSRINERTLPAWTKCFCSFNEIDMGTLNSLVPDWKQLINPKGDENATEKLS